MDKKSLRKMFPNLAREIENGDVKINIESVRADADSVETELPDKFLNYSPTMIDFIRRCDTEVQAESIVAFMEARGELDKEHAQQIRHQLRQEGVRSFGPKKEDGYYFKQGGLC